MAKKGTTNNPNGRPKGSPNKITIDLRKFIQGFLEGRTEDLEKAWNELDPASKFVAFEKLLSYTLPRLQSTDLSATVDDKRGALDNITFVIKGRDNYES